MALFTIQSSQTSNQIAAHLATLDPHSDRLYADSLITANTELAYSENTTGTNVVSTGTAITDVTNLAISIPASTRPVWIRSALAFFTSAAVVATIQIVEVSNGVDAARTKQRVFSTTAGAFYAIDFGFRLGPTLRTRNFKVQITKTGATGTITAAVPASQDSFDCYIMAEAR